MSILSLSHVDSGSEIPEHSHEEHENTDSTQVVVTLLSKRDAVLECLRQAGGDSLSIGDVAEETSLKESDVRRVLRSLASGGTAETREVFEDENEPGSYYLTEPMLDRLAI